MRASRKWLLEVTEFWRKSIKPLYDHMKNKKHKQTQKGGQTLTCTGLCARTLCRQSPPRSSGWTAAPRWCRTWPASRWPSGRCPRPASSSHSSGTLCSSWPSSRSGASRWGISLQGQRVGWRGGNFSAAGVRHGCDAEIITTWIRWAGAWRLLLKRTGWATPMTSSTWSYPLAKRNLSSFAAKKQKRGEFLFPMCSSALCKEKQNKFQMWWLISLWIQSKHCNKLSICCQTLCLKIMPEMPKS